MYNKPEIETQVIKPKMVSKFENDEFRIISESDETLLDKSVEDLEKFITYNHGLGRTEMEKDQLYGEAKTLWVKYVEIFRQMKINFHLSQEQFDYFTEILRDKIEYDSNTIFFAIELTDTLGNWVNTNTQSDQIIKSYDTDPVSANYLYHLISTVKVKGLTHESYLFAQVLRKIHEVIKIVNYYDNHAKSLSKSVQDWVASFEPQNSEYHPQYN